VTHGSGIAAEIQYDSLEEPLSLPCGGSSVGTGMETVSVYRSNGPLLANASLSILTSTVYVGQPFDVIAVVLYAGVVNAPIGNV